MDFLHKKKIIYRDFNLNNFILNEEGYILFTKFHNVRLLTDSNPNNDKYYGAPEYLAPEVINGEGQNEMSDWWSFGIVIYEMLLGIPPFIDDDNDKIYNMILNNEIKFPKKNNISAEAKDLLLKLLIKEKNDRLGFDGGFDVIKKHYFFKGIDIDALEKMQVEVPFKPTIEEEELNVDMNDEKFLFFDQNINLNFELSEEKLENIKKNQDMFTDFYE